MPYIPKNRRLQDAQNAGELNFSFTVVINDYLKMKGVSYQTFNDVMGALEGTKLELYRQLIAPYEDKKKKENGDVYDRSKL